MRSLVILPHLRPLAMTPTCHKGLMPSNDRFHFISINRRKFLGNFKVPQLVQEAAGLRVRADLAVTTCVNPGGTAENSSSSDAWTELEAIALTELIEPFLICWDQQVKVLKGS